jgi:hypothetical protein
MGAIAKLSGAAGQNWGASAKGWHGQTEPYSAELARGGREIRNPFVTGKLWPRRGKPKHAHATQLRMHPQNCK